MSIRSITDEEHFHNELEAAGENLVVVDFTAVWCGPCQHIAPHFEMLAAKYTEIIFLKVDVDKCQDIALSQGVRAMPTFLFYRKCNKIDSLQGADADTLSTKLQDHLENKIGKNTEAQDEMDTKENIDGAFAEHTDGEDMAAGLMDLNCFILKQGCECLNECNDHPLAHCLISNDEFYLQSDCDEQLIMSISFSQLVKINAMRIKAPEDRGPKELRIFTNLTNTPDFDLAETMPCVQELNLKPEDFVDGSAINLRFVRFQNVQSIQIYVRNNQKGGEITRIDYIGFIGSPVKTTKMTDFKRVAGKAGEVC